MFVNLIYIYLIFKFKWTLKKKDNLKKKNQMRNKKINLEKSCIVTFIYIYLY